MPKSTEYYQAIVDNFDNGNITSAREEVRKLTKLQLIALIRVWGDYMNLGIALDDIEGLLAYGV